MVLTNDKIRLHVEYAVRCLFHFPTNAQQRVHFRSSIFNLSGHRRMMNVNESAHVFAPVPPAMANKVALAFFFGFKRSCCPASSSENHSLKPSCMTVCALPHTGTQCCVCPHAFVSVCTLCLCLRPLRRGACQDPWEGSKGEVVNQDRQEQHPGCSLDDGVAGCCGSLSPDPSLIRAPIKNHSSAEAGKTTFCSLALTSHHETRAQEHLGPAHSWCSRKQQYIWCTFLIYFYRTGFVLFCQLRHHDLNNEEQKKPQTYTMQYASNIQLQHI